VNRYRLSSEQSYVVVCTYAEGLLARLAHDLELRWEGLRGAAHAAPDVKGGFATLELPLSALRVAGVVSKGQVDRERLSEHEKAQILEKMHEEVFHVGVRGDGTVRIDATLEGSQAIVRIAPPNGPTVEARVRVTVQQSEKTARVAGAVSLSLARLGSSAIKGPMNAFRVKDSVDVSFELAFVPLPP
jgi:hypothetical protein